MPTPSSKGEEMGPPWLRTDPKVREAQDNAGNKTPNLSPNPPTPEPPPPWQVPSERQVNTQPKVYTSAGEKHGAFPIIIFVILILAIIAGIIVYFILR